MGYKISAAARSAYAAMDKYIDFMERHAGKQPRRVYVTKKQHESILAHLTRAKQEQLRDAKPVREFDEYKGCQVLIYGGK